MIAQNTLATTPFRERNGRRKHGCQGSVVERTRRLNKGDVLIGAITDIPVQQATTSVCIFTIWVLDHWLRLPEWTISAPLVYP